MITLGTQTQDPETDTTGPAYRHPHPKAQNTWLHRTQLAQNFHKVSLKQGTLLEPVGPYHREFWDVHIVRFPKTSTKVKIQG